MAEQKAEKTLIRPAEADDAEAILAIYAPYVQNTAVTFECDVPDKQSFRSRMEGIMQEYPYLVAEENGKILGYAYAGPFHGRAAFKHTAEISVYLKKECRHQGIGRQLYLELKP